MKKSIKWFIAGILTLVVVAAASNGNAHHSRV